MPLNDVSRVRGAAQRAGDMAANPPAFARAMSRSLVTAADAPFQPFEPRLTGDDGLDRLAIPGKDRPGHLCGHDAGALRRTGGRRRRLRAVGAGQAGAATVIDHDRR